MGVEQAAVVATAAAAAVSLCCCAASAAPVTSGTSSGEDGAAAQGSDRKNSRDGAAGGEADAARPSPAAAEAAGSCDLSEHRRLVVVGTGAERDPDDPHKWNGLSSILLFSLRSDGLLTREFELTDVGVNPMFMCSADRGRRLYAVNMGTKQNAATLQSYAVDHPSRTLTKLGEASTPEGPCHLSTIAKEGRNVFGAPETKQLIFVASYGAGRIGVHPARPDGSLGPAVCTVQHGAGASTTDHSVHFCCAPPCTRLAHWHHYSRMHTNVLVHRAGDSPRSWTPGQGASSRCGAALPSLPICAPRRALPIADIRTQRSQVSRSHRTASMCSLQISVETPSSCTH